MPVVLRGGQSEKKTYTDCTKGKPHKWTCSVKNLMRKMHEAKSCLDIILVCASSRSWNFRSVEEILMNRVVRIFQSSATDWEHASVAMRGAMSRKHVVLNGLQKWNRTTICKCQGWRLGMFSTKRKDDMYTKLKRGKTKAEFPLVSAGSGEEGC